MFSSHWRVGRGKQLLFLSQGHGGPQFLISFHHGRIALVNSQGQLGKWGSKVEEKERKIWASHDVGRLSGGQSPSIHHFRDLRL
jgi:hypothetical protein